jgi:hypothetical protein
VRETLAFLSKDKRDVPFPTLKALGKVPRIEKMSEHSFPPQFTLS